MRNNIYDVIIVGAGPGGIYAAYELMINNPDLKIAIFEAGNSLEKRKCPIDGNKVKSCINCKSCAIMKGFGGAGAFSDGKFNITNDFGGTLYEYVGKEKAIELMEYVDKINLECGAGAAKRYSQSNDSIKTKCLQNGLHLLEAEVRHLGTDINYQVLNKILNKFKDNENIDIFFNSEVSTIERKLEKEQFPDIFYEQEEHAYYDIKTKKGENFKGKNCIISVGRSGSKWMEKMCKSLNIDTKSNRVDVGVRVELPAEIFKHLTDELYESKIVYRTQKYADLVRTFCMNPYGEVVTENTNGIITVNGHSYHDHAMHTKNTNFALLVSKHFTEPFNDSTAYAESIAKLSNMLGGGVIVQRFGDLIAGRRSTESRITRGFLQPTLSATPGDLSLVIPKRILDDIVEMIYALDKVAPGTANEETLLYGVEVKFYNMEVDVDKNLETKYSGLYIIGDGSGITHSLSHASASGVHVARNILEKLENKND